MAKTKDLTVGEQVVSLREDGKSWAEISEELSIGAGKAAFLYMCETVDEADRIKYKNDDDLAAKVVKLRDTGLSWGVLAARSGVTEGKLRKLYESQSGTPALGNRIGKGGRYPSGAERPEQPAKPAASRGPAGKKAAPAKAAAKKAPAAGKAPTGGADGKKGLGDMTLAELKGRLDGKIITVDLQNGQGNQRITVKGVKRVKDGEISLTDSDGKARTFLLTQVIRASR